MATWRLDSTVTERYMKLDQGDNVLATYVWIDGTGEVRRKGGGGMLLQSEEIRVLQHRAMTNLKSCSCMQPYLLDNTELHVDMYLAFSL